MIALTDSTDRIHIAKQLSRLFQSAKKPRPYLQVLATALAVAPRVSEAFTVDVLDRLEAIQDSLPEIQELRELQERAEMLERALFLAAHFDRSDHVQALVTRFLKLLESQRGQGAAEDLDNLAGQCFRGLRKVGLRDESDRLLHQMASQVMQGQDLADTSQETRQPVGNRLADAAPDCRGLVLLRQERKCPAGAGRSRIAPLRARTCCPWIGPGWLVLTRRRWDRPPWSRR